jgi:hypothetical protein
MELKTNSVDEVKELATYLQGMADASDNQRLCTAGENARRTTSDAVQ